MIVAERVGQLGELLAFRRIPPLEKILEEGIVYEDTFFQIVRVLFAPTTHEIDLLERPELLNAYRVVTRALRSYGPARSRPIFGSEVVTAPPNWSCGGLSSRTASLMVIFVFSLAVFSIAILRLRLFVRECAQLVVLGSRDQLLVRFRVRRFH
jgi:hypothetical protein